MKVIIKPLDCIEFDGKKIPLGCTGEFVESVLGKPSVMGSSYYYFENEIRFDFDRDNKLEFIELLGGMDGTFTTRNIWHKSVYGKCGQSI